MDCCSSNICDNCTCLVHNHDILCGSMFCNENSSFRKFPEVILCLYDIGFSKTYSFTCDNTSVNQDVVAFNSGRNGPCLFFQSHQWPGLQYIEPVISAYCPLNILGGFIVIFNSNGIISENF